ncbi:MAG: ArsR family transcriptional regulator [Natrialbaceae archaeon]|nr:ArsR family transcriptional regulator [Natrialbaceae archaeon]
MDDRGVDDWKAAASAFDRVRSVSITLTQPRTADWIAGEAAVAGNTARNHLDRLVEMNVLEAISTEGVTRYRPDPLYTRMRALRDLLDERSRDDLLELRATLQEQVTTWQDDHGVDSPEALRERAATVETADRTRDLRHTANDWEIVRYRLGLVEEAITRYPEYSGTAPA